MFIRKTFIAMAACLAMPLVHADAIKGSVSLIVPYPAGGASDVTARIVAKPLASELGSNVIVENIGGASGGIAANKLLNSPADGRAIFQGSPNELIIPPLTIKRVPFTPEDFEIVHPVTTTRMILVARNELPVKNFKEFLELAKSQSKTAPLSYGTPGVGSLYHLLSNNVEKLGGFKGNHIPYQGAAPIMVDLLGNRIDFTIIAYTASTLNAIKAGQYKPLAFLSTNTPQELKDIPSISEFEGYAGLDLSANAAYFVKKGTPEAVRKQLNEAVGNAVRSEAVTKALEADAREVPPKMTLEEADAFYKAEVQKYRSIVEQAGFQPLD